MKDDTHEIYQWGGVWRFADYGVATYCECSNGRLRLELRRL